VTRAGGLGVEDAVLDAGVDAVAGLEALDWPPGVFVATTW